MKQIILIFMCIILTCTSAAAKDLWIVFFHNADKQPIKMVFVDSFKWGEDGNSIYIDAVDKNKSSIIRPDDYISIFRIQSGSKLSQDVISSMRSSNIKTVDTFFFGEPWYCELVNEKVFISGIKKYFIDGKGNLQIDLIDNTRVDVSKKSQVAIGSGDIAIKNYSDLIYYGALPKRPQ